jgi:3-deoxy-D-manno-octulosonic-acid transferase
VLNAYDLIAIPALKTFARVGSLFNAKLKKGIDGRRDLERTIESHYEGITAPRILIHVASFGELEQAKPIIDALALRIPKPHIHLTFFSPSGYENASGKYPTPDLITYSPFDDGAAVKRFLSIVQPDLALFVRYDVWPNMAKHLRTLQVPSILFSATFDPKRESVVVRKLHRHMYDQLSRIFTISVEDKAGFERLGVSAPIDVAGDTRVDQVSRRAEAIKRGKKHSLPQNIRHVLKDQFVIVAGSTSAQAQRLSYPCPARADRNPRRKATAKVWIESDRAFGC